MTSEQIKLQNEGQGEMPPEIFWLREVALQLAERNTLKRQELDLRQTAQANDRLTTKNRRLTQALQTSNKRMREDLNNHRNAGHKSLAVERMEDQLKKNEELLNE